MIIADSHSIPSAGLARVNKERTRVAQLQRGFVENLFHHGRPSHYKKKARLYLQEVAIYFFYDPRRYAATIQLQERQHAARCM